ncbi:dihydroorotase, partial [Candidatus Liberibacter sp.]|uniref:dihydroorotase n=1 Tax=Candidatus Liberibacter sp. TaxID=34022 RepID=UPI0015F404F0
MTALVLNNLRIIDPSRDLDEIGTIIVENGIVLAAGRDALNQGFPTSAEVRDCKGLVAAPGLIDARVIPESSPEKYSENIVAISKEAITGGVTSLIVMPFISSLVDEYTLIRFVLREAQKYAVTNIYPAASLTRNMAGEEINEIGLLKEQGVVSFVHGPFSLKNTQVLFNSMHYAHMFDTIVALDTNDYFLGSNGVMNEGIVANWLGLPCIPAESEIIPLERDLRIAKRTGGRYHASVVSTPQSISILNRAKENKIRATCGISINNLILNENDIGEYNSFCKVLPPLRSEEERIGMVDALAKGDIDIIVSDHTPRHADTKNRPFTEASFGAIGLETMLSAALRLFHGNHVSLKRLIEAMST